MRGLREQWMMREGEIWGFLLVQIVAFVFGMGMSLILGLNEEGARAYVPMGFILGVGAPLFVMIFSGLGLADLFNKAVGMGAVRHRFVPMYLLASVLEFAVLMLAALLLGTLEQQVCLRACPGLVYEGPAQLFNGTVIGLMALASLAVASVQLLTGALYLKYGRTAMWILWALWMLLCIGGPRGISALGRVFSGKAYASMIETGAILLVVCVSAVFATCGYFMLMRQQVK